MMHDRSAQNAALASLLQDLRPARASYGRLALTAPWGIELPFQDGVRFHLVVEGGCELHLDGEPPLFLDAGDIAMLPQGGAHAIRDAPKSGTVPLASLPAERIGDAFYRLTAGAGGPETLLICCTIGFDSRAARRLLAEMPVIVILRADSADAKRIAGLVALMADEARRERMAMATLLPRIADIVVTWTVRAWAETAETKLFGWLAAMQEPGLAKALTAIHANLERRWTIESLARTAGMSRTKFNRLFTSRLGQAPGRYLLEWRMASADEQLKAADQTLAKVAATFGYGSEAAFARAFKRVQGVSPGAARRGGEARPQPRTGRAAATRPT